MPIVVFGGTGSVGSALVELLLRDGADVRVITHSPKRASLLPHRVDAYIGDLDRPESLRGAMRHAEAVFLLVPNGPAETHRGLTALSIVLDAKPETLVYLSADLCLRAPLVPHAGSKLAVEAAIRASDINHTILRPTYFAQNDLIMRDALLRGIYQIPCGKMPLARVDVRDVAVAASNALLGGPGTRRSILLSSRDQPNGEEAAALWSAALGATVAFPDATPEAWAETVRAYLPAWMVFDLVLMYRHFQIAGHPVREQDLEEQAPLLPAGPRPYCDFIEECARDWRRDDRS